MTKTATIRTPDQRLRVFVSSTLEELAPERRAAREAITGLHLTPVLFEAGARPYPSRELYRAYLSQSDIFIGLYWQHYGRVLPTRDTSGLEDEYQLSEGKPRLIYIKIPAPQREPLLQNLIDRIRSENVTTYQKFSTSAELQELMANDLAQLLTDHFTQPPDLLTSASVQFAPLPIPRNPLIDRTRELVEVQDLLLRDDVGLVTLTGAGGVGKTRLAIQIATNMASHFGDGAAFISLAQVKDPDLVVPAISHALNVSGDRSRPLVESLIELLRNSHLLLVVDNVEQVISVAPQLAQILEQAANLKVLFTTREPLQVRGEWTVQVSPLALPDPANLPNLNTLREIPAVALFLQRAREVNPNFVLTQENAQDVAEICDRLNGLPLALELAAARVNVLPPKLLLTRLSHRLPFLTHGVRDLPERQRTLRNLIAWSYDLLDSHEQGLFRSLSIFDGSFGVDGAIAIENEVSTDQQKEYDKRSDEMIDRLESLVSKNLLGVEQGVEGAVRFSMLSTIQEYGREQVEAHGEHAALQERFVHFFLKLAQTAEPLLYEPERYVWMERLATEDVNLQAVLTCCKENSNTLEIGLRLAGALSFFWFMSGYLHEGRCWLETMLTRTAETDRSNARGKALYGAGLLSWKQGQAEVGARYAEEALSILREGGDTLGSAYAELVLGAAWMSLGRVAQARPLLNECLSIFKEMKRTFGEGFTLALLGINALLSEKRTEAFSCLNESLQRAEQIHDELSASVTLGLLVETVATQGDKEAARLFLEKFQQLLKRARNRWVFGRFLGTSAIDFQHNYKLYETAKILYQGSLSFWQEIQRLENGMGLITGLVGLAEIAAIQGHEGLSGWLFGAADHLAPSSGFYRDALNERVAQTGKQLDAPAKAAFEARWAEGQTATLEQAIRKALHETG